MDRMLDTCDPLGMRLYLFCSLLVIKRIKKLENKTTDKRTMKFISNHNLWETLRFEASAEQLISLAQGPLITSKENSSWEVI